MNIHKKEIAQLVEFVKVDRFYVSCHFKCKVKNKTVISTVPFEPYDGKIEFTWREILFHPIKSYNRYYHTPISIYNTECDNTIVYKAFKEVSNYFIWNPTQKRYIYN